MSFDLSLISSFDDSVGYYFMRSVVSTSVAFESRRTDSTMEDIPSSPINLEDTVSPRRMTGLSDAKQATNRIQETWKAMQEQLRQHQAILEDVLVESYKQKNIRKELDAEKDDCVHQSESVKLDIQVIETQSHQIEMQRVHVQQKVLPKQQARLEKAIGNKTLAECDWRNILCKTDHTENHLKETMEKIRDIGKNTLMEMNRFTAIMRRELNMMQVDLPSNDDDDVGEREVSHAMMTIVKMEHEPQPSSVTVTLDMGDSIDFTDDELPDSSDEHAERSFTRYQIKGTSFADSMVGGGDCGIRRSFSNNDD